MAYLSPFIVLAPTIPQNSFYIQLFCEELSFRTQLKNGDKNDPIKSLLSIYTLIISTHIMTHKNVQYWRLWPTDIFWFKSSQSLILSALPSDVNSPWAHSDPRTFSRLKIEAVKSAYAPYFCCFSRAIKCKIRDSKSFIFSWIQIPTFTSVLSENIN